MEVKSSDGSLRGPSSPEQVVFLIFGCSLSSFDKCFTDISEFVPALLLLTCDTVLEMGMEILNSGDGSFLRVGSEDELGRWKGPQGTRALLLLRGVLQGGTI